MAGKRPASETPITDPRIPDIIGEFRAWCATSWRVDDGWDVSRLHISDLAQCPALVAARRRGEKMLPFSAESVAAMEAGLAFERLVHRFVENTPALNGWRRYYQETIGLFIKRATGELAGVTTPFTPDEECAGGKLDFLIVDAPNGQRLAIVWDTKWVMAAEKKSKAKDPTSGRTITEVPKFDEPPRYEHLVQSAAYALAVNAEIFGIFRGGRALDVVWYRTEPWRQQITTLLKQQLALTDPKAPAPDPVPPSWQWNDDHTIAMACYGCDWGGCSENKDPRDDREEAIV